MGDKQYGGNDPHPKFDRRCEVHDREKDVVKSRDEKICAECAAIRINKLEEGLNGVREEFFDELHGHYKEFAQDASAEEMLAYRRAIRDMNSLMKEEF